MGKGENAGYQHFVYNGFLNGFSARVFKTVNTFPMMKFMYLTKLKVIVEDKKIFIVARISVFLRVENIVGR